MGPGSEAKSAQKVSLRDIFTTSKRHVSRSRAKTSLGIGHVFFPSAGARDVFQDRRKKIGAHRIVFALWRHEGDHHQNMKGRKRSKAQTAKPTDMPRIDLEILFLLLLAFCTLQPACSPSRRRASRRRTSATTSISRGPERSRRYVHDRSRARPIYLTSLRCRPPSVPLYPPTPSIVQASITTYLLSLDYVYRRTTMMPEVRWRQARSILHLHAAGVRAVVGVRLG